MKINKIKGLLSLFLLAVLFCIVFADMGGAFNYSDIPFALVFVVYLLHVFWERTHGKMAFALALFFLFWMGLSYIPTGAGQITERMGEWFYLFFVLGVIQSSLELRRKNE